MATNLTLIRKRVKAMNAIRSMHDLYDLLDLDELKIYTCAHSPKYKVYKIPKKSGYRLIEDPHADLKYIQGILNDHMQALYYYKRPACAYGFCISSSSEDERNVVSNAKKHLGCSHLLNIDLKDFFHQIKKEKVRAIIQNHIHGTDSDVRDTMTSLFTYKGRLPMGAPTSPILSNFAMIELDDELMQLCDVYNIVYTRYADDLSFSTQGDHKINIDIKDMIYEAIKFRGFEINPLKVKWYGPKDVKYVTGIVVGSDGISLPAEYLPRLEEEISIYAHTVLADARYHTGMSGKKMELFKQEISGKINFGLMVNAHDEYLINLIDKYNKADDVEDISFSWLDIPYLF